MGGGDFLNRSVCIECHAVDAKLAVEATVGVWIIVAVINDIVIITFLEDTVMSGTVNGTVSIGFEDAAAIGVRPQRLV